MSVIVQKFGGTSVADSAKILAAARKAIQAKREGHDVVVVVSAMGHTTDMLIDLAKQITDSPSPREMDMLLSTGEQVSVALMAMAVHRLGYEAVSFTGAQIGIVTDSTHTKARIRSISTDRLKKAFKEGKIVIAAGFQGVDEQGNITTLGRGGSDTTAVALAAVLGAERCEIYTDVDGVYTTDPRIVPEARLLRQISYDEMLELASAGAAVMHNRSIEFGKKFLVPIYVRSSMTDSPGTLITTEPESLAQPVCGAAMVKNEARITVQKVPDRPGAAMTLFSRIAARNIPTDMIVQNVAENGEADISFTVFRDDLSGALRAVGEAVQELGAGGYTYDENVSKISIVGMGMARQPGVAQKMFAALADRGINILMISTSEIKISTVVERDRAEEALRAVHEAFRLDEPPEKLAPAPPSAPPSKSKAAVNYAARMAGMEDLIITGLDLDESQSRVTLVGVPDRPGVAARIFDQIARAGVVVDMIVQSVGREGKANVTFTVPHKQLDSCLQAASAVAKALGCPPPASSPKVAKLSLSGVGMRTHTLLVRRMFQCLADAKINVDMISTSEVRFHVVVDAAQGRKALDALKKEFADAIV